MNYEAIKTSILSIALSAEGGKTRRVKNALRVTKVIFLNVPSGAGLQPTRTLFLVGPSMIAITIGAETSKLGSAF
ncbi:MAG TPA: hypothetical protein VI387_00400 [Candidatus Brocadiales bacterium]|nr:hypothetical protein [Candidatus Brocadiales bacterium]